MTSNENLLSAGLHIVNRHKRFILWFWVLNLALAYFGAIAFRQEVASTLDHSLLAHRLMHGFDLPILLEMMARPETGSTEAPTKVAAHFGFVFFFATLILLPGVIESYTNEGRLSREEFFRVCGRNLWRFIRVVLLFAILAGILAALLFAAKSKLVKMAGEHTNELLPFYTEILCLSLIFLVMTAIRIWFDLSQINIVFRDQPSVLRSLSASFRHTRRHLLPLLGSYVAIALVAALVLVCGVWIWHVLVPSSNVVVAFVVSQAMLILWLWARFWQRGVGAAFYLREMAVIPSPIPAPEPVVPVSPAPVPAPEAGPATAS